MKKLLLIIVILIFLATKIVLATEVGGHLTEDTVWSPENNPYHVVSNIFIEQGVTLTIQPGTQIKLDSAELIYGGLVAFLLTGEDSEAKLFWVDGRIIAEGTADDPITFTRAQDSLYYHWGTIYLSEQSGLSVFKHCLIEYSALIFTSTVDPQGAIYSHNNGGTITENCHFIDNMYAIQGGTQKMSITKCRFEMIEDLHSSLNSNYNYLGVTGLIAGNIFIGEDAIMPGTNTAHIVRNTFQSTIITIDIGGADNPNFQDPIYIYKNTFLDFDTGIIGSGYPGDSLYVKKNDFHGPGWGIFLEPIYFEVEGNMFDNCYFRISGSPHSMVRNNMIKSFGGTGYSGNASIFENNIIYNCGEGMSGLGRDGFRNNVFASNDDVFSSISDRAIIENSAVVGNDRLYSRNIYGNPIFRNCILDFELPEECIDGGGNIWVDSLMIDGLFEDWQNGDFHLTPGSLAIDAGFDTTDYYPYLDPDDNLRVWDGDNDGQAIIDIGPYEYGAPASGGIHGTIFQTEGGDPVDYVFLKINNQSGEFEFADSSGYYEFLLPPGVYDIYASRVFYDNVVVEGIEVVQGEFTEMNFWMESTLGIEDNTRQPVIVSDLVAHQNYPNPFNPTTTIAFDLPVASSVELTVYNIAGQKVKTLLDEYRKAGSHELTWNGASATGQAVSSGLYFYRINAGEETATGKMILMK